MSRSRVRALAAIGARGVARASGGSATSGTAPVGRVAREFATATRAADARPALAREFARAGLGRRSPWDAVGTVSRGDSRARLGAAAPSRAYASSEGKTAEDAESDAEREEKTSEGDDEIVKLRGELEEKEAKVAELTDRILRSMAEMENLRERTRRQAEDAKKFAVQGFCKDLLDVADNLERAIATVPEGGEEADAGKVKAMLKSFREGVVMTEKQLASVFSKHGVTKFNPEGEEFDANAHMALFNVPIPPGSNAKAGTVAAVTKTGYTLHERVIRAAEVGVYQ